MLSKINLIKHSRTIHSQEGIRDQKLNEQHFAVYLDQNQIKVRT